MPNKYSIEVTKKTKLALSTNILILPYISSTEITNYLNLCNCMYNLILSMTIKKVAIQKVCHINQEKEYLNSLNE